MPIAREILAQARERTLVQEAGEIVGAVGQQFAAAEPDEEIEIFALDLLDRRRRAAASRERDMRDAERRRIAAQARRAARAEPASGARASSAASSAYSCARATSTSSTSADGRARDKDRAAARARSTPVAASTASTRSAGTRSQFETEGCEMPMRRASSVTPPAARIASLSPGSRIATCSLRMSPPHCIEKRSKARVLRRRVVNSWAIVARL